MIAFCTDWLSHRDGPAATARSSTARSVAAQGANGLRLALARRAALARRVALACLLVMGGARAANADTFVLSGGGSVEGVLLNPDESPRKQYVIQTAVGKLTLLKPQVQRVITPTLAQQNYERFLPGMPDTSEGHWKMAEWCRENDLRPQREFHLERVVAHDPDHEAARRGLGYSRVDGKWLRADEYMASQGYVRYKGSWRLAQEVAMEESREAVELAQKEWKRKMKMWRGWIGKSKHDDAVANFRAVRDWRASVGLAEMLDDETASPVKLLYMEVLGRLHVASATTALVKRAIEDDDAAVRERALDHLRQFGAKAAVGVFIRALEHKENVKINRAGVALGRMQDRDAIEPLIDALLSKHKVLVGAPGSNAGLGPIGATFGNNGQSGLSAGKKPTIIESEVPNRDVRDALIAITGVNHGFDRAAWRRWYVEVNTPKVVDLRRG